MNAELYAVAVLIQQERQREAARQRLAAEAARYQTAPRVSPFGLIRGVLALRAWKAGWLRNLRGIRTWAANVAADTDAETVWPRLHDYPYNLP